MRGRAATGETFGSRAAGGFTLVEVMVVMVIIAILAAIALPSYFSSIARGHRSEARMTLTQAAQWMERWRTQNNSYQNAALPAALQRSPASGTLIYNITVVTPTPGQYILAAAPVGPMANDTCGTLTLDQTGARTAAGNMDLCWGR